MKTVRHLVIVSIILLVLFSVVVPAFSAKAAGLTYSLRTRDTGIVEIRSQQTHSAPTAVKLATLASDDYAGVRFKFAPGQLKLDQLNELSYWQYVAARQSDLDIFPDIWLDLNSDGIADASDYGGYMQAEPLYTTGSAPLQTWTKVDAMALKWSVGITIDDPYNAPTIADLQANSANVNRWTAGVDFGNLDVLQIDFRVGYGGPWANFTSYLDDVSINTTAESFTVQNVWVDDDWAGSAPGTPVGGHTFGLDAFASIQPGIDTVAPGGSVLVYPGNYNETAANRAPSSMGGVYQFGLFVGVDKAEITIQGVNASSSPVTDPTQAAANVTTNATNNFGNSGIFVEGDGVTFAGLRILPKTPGDNKTFEILGDAFTLKDTHIDVAGGGSVYFNDTRFQNNTSHIQTYTIQNNWLDQGASVDITSGTGYTGPASGRLITQNRFTGDGADWALISFRGSGGRAWYVNPVGGAVITQNVFLNAAEYIRATGGYAEDTFDWASYWNDNNFDRAAITGVNLPAQPRAYSYSTFTNARRIGGTIQGEVDNAEPGDTVLLKAGTYAEQVVIAKNVKLQGLDAANTIVQAPASMPTSDKPESAIIRVDGSTTQVEISGLTVKGPGPSGCGSIRAGIYVSGGAFANIHDNLILDIRDALNNGNLSGCQNGVGILVGRNAFSTTGSAAIAHNTIQGYQKGGIVVDNAGSSATISDNSVTGAGPTPSIAQNGIQVSRGATANVANNVVSGHMCDQASCGSDLMNQATSDGILLYYPGQGTVINGNDVSNNDLGINTMTLPAVTGTTVSGNKFIDNRYAGALLNEGIVAFNANEVSGAGNLGVALISYQSDQGNVVASLNNNLIADAKVGLQVLQEAASAHHPVLVAQLNSIQAVTTGLDNQTAYTTDAIKNWWQSAHGPKHTSITGGDGQTVTGLASLSPWLCSGTDTQPAITGFQPASGPMCTAEPTRLVFSTQPGESVVNLLLTPQPVVRVEDNAGNLAINFSGKALLTFGHNPGGASLSGTTLQSFTNGLATFTNLSVNQPGNSYKLAAQAAGVNDIVESNPFNVVLPKADLSVAQSGPTAVTAGDQMNLTLQVSNLGPQTAEEVRVVNTLPAGSTLVSATGSGWTCAAASGVVTCQRDSLVMGAAPDITLVITAPANLGNVTNQISASSTTSDPVSANNQASKTISVVAIPVTADRFIYLPIVVK